MFSKLRRNDRQSRESADSDGITIGVDDLVMLKAQARGFSFSPRQPVTSLLAGRHASRLRGRGLAFEELRGYHPGDDVRTIDWKATARLRSPHVRVYSEERERPVLILIDQRESMFFGSRRAMKSVVAAELAALAAWKTLAGGDRVGGIIFGDDAQVTVKPHRSESRVLQLLGEVSRQNAALAEQFSAPERPPRPQSSASLNDALRSAIRLARHDFLVVLVSDLVGADDQTCRLVTNLQAHNDVLVAAVYDPMGTSFRSVPGMFAVGASGPIELPVGAAFENAFRESFDALLDHWATTFGSLRIPLMPISTGPPVAQQVRDLFGQAR